LYGVRVVLFFDFFLERIFLIIFLYFFVIIVFIIPMMLVFFTADLLLLRIRFVLLKQVVGVVDIGTATPLALFTHDCLCHEPLVLVGGPRGFPLLGPHLLQTVLPLLRGLQRGIGVALLLLECFEFLQFLFESLLHVG